MPDILSSIAILVGYILTGNRKRIGWIFSLLGNIGYIIILRDTELKGLIIVSIIMSLICIYNFFKWK